MDRFQHNKIERTNRINRTNGVNRINRANGTNRPRPNIFNNNGQIIIEALIAIFIITISILVFLGLLARATALNRVINDRYTAVYLAAEGIEIVKNIIDANYIQHRSWNSGVSMNRDYEIDYTSKSFLPNQNRYLRLDLSSGIYSYSSGNASPFRRTIYIRNISQHEIQVNSVVRWSLGGVSNEVDLEDHFFDWR